jgi:hypothetical protein
MLELEYNLNGKSNMDELSKMYNDIIGRVQFDTTNDLKSSLNEKGLEKLDKEDENFIRNFDKKIVLNTYLKDNFKVDVDITDDKEYSFILGMLVNYQNSFSKSNIKERELIKYDNSTKLATKYYIALRDKFVDKRDYNRKVEILENKIFKYYSKNNKGNIDYITFLYGSTEHFKLKTNKIK